VHTPPYNKLDKVLACARLVGAGVAPALGRLVMPLSLGVSVDSVWSRCGGYVVTLHSNPPLGTKPTTLVAERCFLD
jgi:hypothetical protein